MSKSESIYSTHKEQRDLALPPSDRIVDLEEALQKVFEPHIEYREVPVILFDRISVEDLGRAFSDAPIVLKSVLACANIAQRAIKRDLGLDVNTYGKKLSTETAFALAGYLKPLLPNELPVPALMILDHFWWIDKEMRKAKGRWEKRVLKFLNEGVNIGSFKKRKFVHPGGQFEIDAAYPTKGDIEVAVDVKRFESPRDFHKRGDEITQKVGHLKEMLPDSAFYAVIYFPFPSEHAEVRRRYQGQRIDGIYFAGETDSSIQEATTAILSDAYILGESQ